MTHINFFFKSILSKSTKKIIFNLTKRGLNSARVLHDLYIYTIKPNLYMVISPFRDSKINFINYVRQNYQINISLLFKVA